MQVSSGSERRFKPQCIGLAFVGRDLNCNHQRIASAADDLRQQCAGLGAKTLVTETPPPGLRPAPDPFPPRGKSLAPIYELLNIKHGLSKISTRRFCKLLGNISKLIKPSV